MVYVIYHINVPNTVLFQVSVCKDLSFIHQTYQLYEQFSHDIE